MDYKKTYEEWQKSMPATFTIRSISIDNVDWASVLGERVLLESKEDTKVRQYICADAYLKFDEEIVPATIMFEDIMDGEYWEKTENCEVVRIHGEPVEV